METRVIIGITVLLVILGTIGAIIYLVVHKDKDSPHWLLSEWVPPTDQCSTCGDCEQTRTAICVEGQDKVDESLCGEKPETERKVPGVPCQYNWTPGGPWDDKECKFCIDGVCKPKVCGNFYETKSDVNCVDQFGNVVSDDMCQGPKPDKKSCDLPDCVFSWKAGNWNLPSPYICGTGSISRSVSCIRLNDGSVTFNSNCKDLKPATTRVYPDKPNYPDDPTIIPCSGWFSSDWKEDCKTTAVCGLGNQTRDVVCKSNGEIKNPPDPYVCPDDDKPTNTQVCNTEVNCDCCGVNKPSPPNSCACDWEVSDWSPASCTYPDLSQYQTRSVLCKNQDKTKVVDSSNCKNPIPASAQYCNPGKPIIGPGYLLLNNPALYLTSSSYVQTGVLPFDMAPVMITLPLYSGWNNSPIDVLLTADSGTVYSGSSSPTNVSITFPLTLQKGDPKIKTPTNITISFQTRDDSPFTIGVCRGLGLITKVGSKLYPGGIGMRLNYN